MVGKKPSVPINPESDLVKRNVWIEAVCTNFVQTGPKKRTYYRLVLETLWPSGQTLPGPVIYLSDLRKIINEYRGEAYADLPRRIRELQGEEGVFGLERYGSGKSTRYQLIHTELGPKRNPRTGLRGDLWNQLLNSYNHRCAVCGRANDIMRLDQDHKVPRLRGGGDQLENWQPLCKECNNFKSTACRGCDLDCHTCPWAFPERYGPIKLTEKNTEQIRKQSLKSNEDPSTLLNRIVRDYFNSRNSQN